MRKRKWKYGNMEEWNCDQGALKAQLQSAQGSALGHATYPSFSAPCKGSYLKIKTWKN